MRPEDRLSDVAARQFQIWKEADFRTFKPRPESFAHIAYITPLLARTFCGIFAGLFVAPLGIFYHGSMIGKEFVGRPEQDSEEKIQKHKEALYVDSAAFVATLGFGSLFYERYTRCVYYVWTINSNFSIRSRQYFIKENDLSKIKMRVGFCYVW